MSILRENKKLVDEYLSIRHQEVSPLTVDSSDKAHLILLLEYADEIPFYDLPFTREPFAEYLKTPGSRRDGKKGIHSDGYRCKVQATARRFFEWLMAEKEDYANISIRWIRTLKGKQSPNKPKQGYFSLDEIIQIARTPVKTLNEERIRAACIFLYFSGMRIGAFLTLPISAVDLDHLIVRQWPSLGVATKLGKKATTRLLEIPEYQELVKIIKNWDAKVTTQMTSSGMWFAPISPRTGELDPIRKTGKHRRSGFYDDLEIILQKAGVEYKSTHKFRHGHIRYLRDNAKTVRHLEAISNNAMQNVETMLRYGQLGDEETHDEIQKLCKNNGGSTQAFGVESKILLATQLLKHLGLDADDLLGLLSN